MGSYPITLSGGSDLNYAFTLVPGTLTVSPVTLSVQANPQSRAYGQTNPVLTATISGFVNGDNSGVVSGQAGLSTSAAINSPVGSYRITTTAGTLSAVNYTFSPLDGLLNVTQAVLTVTADNKSRLYGATNPVFTATISGFADGEGTNVVSGEAALSTLATPDSPVGHYDITAELGSLSATNYSFTFTNGTLTVGKALLVVAADPQSRTYGAANPSADL